MPLGIRDDRSFAQGEPRDESGGATLVLGSHGDHVVAGMQMLRDIELVVCLPGITTADLLAIDEGGEAIVASDGEGRFVWSLAQ